MKSFRRKDRLAKIAAKRKGVEEKLQMFIKSAVAAGVPRDRAIEQARRIGLEGAANAR